MIDRTVEFLHRAGAAQAAHGHGRSLLAHLQGTARIVEAWQQPSIVRNAALFHSIYGTDVYLTSVIPAETSRDEVRAVVGTDAERLAYLFGTIRRDDFWKRVRASKPNQTISVRRHRDEHEEHVEPSERFAMIVLYLANTAEQVRAQDGGPAPWLADFVDKAKLLRDALI